MWTATGTPTWSSRAAKPSRAETQRRRAGVAVLLNDGMTFKPTPPLYFDGENPYMAVELGDLDGDGNAEVVVSEGGAVVVLWDRAGQLEVGPRLVPPAPANADKLGQREFALADVDGDGLLDVVSWGGGSRSPSYLIVYRNTGERKFTGAIAATIRNEYLSGAAVADFDGDSDVDVVEDGGTDRLVVLINRGDGRFDVTARPRRVGAEKLFPADRRREGAGIALCTAQSWRVLVLRRPAAGHTSHAARDRRAQW